MDDFAFELSEGLGHVGEQLFLIGDEAFEQFGDGQVLVIDRELVGEGA